MDERNHAPEVSRRGFLTGACTGMAALAASQLIGPAAAFADDAQGAAAKARAEERATTTDFDTINRGSYHVNMNNVDPIPAVAEPDSYDHETEILLLGFGVGGTSAALTAVNRGCKVMAMERSTANNWYEHGGVFFVSAIGIPEWQEATGIPAWNEEIAKAAALKREGATFAGDDLDAAVSLYLAIPQAFEQVRSLGSGCQFERTEILPYNKNTMVPTNDNLGGDKFYPWLNKYFAVENIIKDHCLEKGLEILWGTPASNLIVDGSGKVVGAKGIDADGNEVYVKAKAVIDCAGGYAANYDMVKFYGLVDEVIGCNVGALVNDGTVMRLCQGAGAGVRCLPRIDDMADGGIDTVGRGLPWNFLQNVDGIKDRYVQGLTYAPLAIGRQPVLKVNKYGKRFMNEDSNWNNKVREGYRQPGHRVYTIIDGKIDDIVNDLYHVQNRVGVCERLVTDDRYVYFSDDDIRPLNDWHVHFEEGLEKGLIVKADTLEELAEKLGINASNLLETVERYNAACEAGVDEEFGKDARTLYPVQTPPFYGTERCPGYAWSVNGGVPTTKDGRVMTDDGTVIPGLFCGAGDAAIANRNTGKIGYDGAFFGGSVFSMGMGYIAANAAADDILA